MLEGGIKIANTSMAMKSSTGDQELDNKLMGFQTRFLEEYKKAFRSAGLQPRVTLWGQPHDSITGVDAESIIFLASKGTATDTGSSDYYYDFSNKGVIPVPNLIKQAAAEFGWSGIESIKFDKPLLDTPVPVQQQVFQEMALESINQIKQKLAIIQSLGIGEAYTYLGNARSRFNDGGPAGYSDCKANCRNAIISLMKSLAGTENIGEAVKTLNKKGLLGEREADVIESIADLVKCLYGQASKTGSHPPLATKEDAKFTLELTEVAIEYLATQVTYNMA